MGGNAGDGILLFCGNFNNAIYVVFCNIEYKLNVFLEKVNR